MSCGYVSGPTVIPTRRLSIKRIAQTSIPIDSVLCSIIPSRNSNATSELATKTRKSPLHSHVQGTLEYGDANRLRIIAKNPVYESLVFISVMVWSNDYFEPAVLSAPEVLGHG